MQKFTPHGKIFLAPIVREAEKFSQMNSKQFHAFWHKTQQILKIKSNIFVWLPDLLIALQRKSFLKSHKKRDDKQSEAIKRMEEN